MPVAVGVIVSDAPVTEPVIPLPASGEAVHVYTYVLFTTVCVAVSTVEPPIQTDAGNALATTTSASVIVTVTGVRALSQPNALISDT